MAIGFMLSSVDLTSPYYYDAEERSQRLRMGVVYIPVGCS